MQIERNISLKNKNTFGIDCSADYYAEVRSPEDIRDLINSSEYKTNKRFVLGGGSNLLFAGDFKGLIIDVEIKEKKVIENHVDFAIVEAGAGEVWDDFVKYTIDNGFYGLENLGLIPGKVGAATVQNIGAYGVEQKDFFHSLTGINLMTNEFIELDSKSCEFGYRDSIFKNELKDIFIVTSVRYKLSKKPAVKLNYKDLANEINKLGVAEPSPMDVYETVCRIRERKLPSPEITGNAGSFFKNPVIDNDLFNKVKDKFTGMPYFKLNNEKFKIPAAWLIEQCGWKGKREGNAGVYEKHSLVIVNYGNAKPIEIIKLATDIAASVIEKFEIELEREVLVVG